MATSRGFPFVFLRRGRSYNLCMLNLKKTLLILLSLNLWMIQIHVPQNNNSSDWDLSFNSSYAQVEVLKSASKQKSEKLSRFYLPMLVMLGIGFVAYRLIKNAETFSADMVLFVIGAVLYLVSTILSWKVDKKLKKISHEKNDEQYDALIKQKELIEEAITASNRRETFLGAASASFSAAAVLAGVMHIKEKNLHRVSKSLQQSSNREIKMRCKLNAKSWSPLIDPKSGQTIFNQCMANAAKANVTYKKIDMHITKADQKLDIPRDSIGSKNACQNYNLDMSHVSAELAMLGLVAKPTVAINFDDPDALDKEIEKRFSGKWHILDALIAKSYAQGKAAALKNLLNKSGGQKNLVKELKSAAKSEAGVGIKVKTPGDCVDLMGSDYCSNAQNNQFFLNSRAFVIDHTVNKVVSTILAKKAKAIGTLDKLKGKAKDAARKITSDPKWRKVTSSLKRVVLKRATTYAALTTAGAAVPILSPVLAVAGVGLIAWDIVSLYSDYTKTTTGKSLTENFKGWFSHNESFMDKLDGFSTFIINKAEANTLGLAPAGLGAMKGIINKSSEQVDKWLCKPKGRMVVFGALGGIAALVWNNNRKMNTHLQKDLDGVNELIRKFDMHQSFIDLIIPKANAGSVATPPMKASLPEKVPCLVKSGSRCAEFQSYFNRRIPKNLKLSKVMRGAVKNVSHIGNNLQDQKNFDEKLFRDAAKLASKRKVLLSELRQIERRIESLPTTVKGLRKISDYRKEFRDELLDSTRRTLLASKVPVEEILKMQRGFKFEDVEQMPASVFKEEMESIKSVSIVKTKSGEIEEEKNPVADDGFTDGNQIWSNKNTDLFKIISRRFQVTGYKRLGIDF